MAADALTRAQLEAQRRLRAIAERETARIWRALPRYDRANVDQWLSAVLPVAEATKRQSALLTDAYIARKLRRRPVGIETPKIRGGTPPEKVYERPFLTLWKALSAGKAFEEASAAALARATSTAAMDVQMAMREAANAVQQADDGIFGYQRVANAGACEFCLMIDGAYVKSADAMALHNHCGCGLEPLTEPHPLAASLPNGVAVHQHGELGPVLTDPAHAFTPESQLA